MAFVPSTCRFVDGIGSTRATRLDLNPYNAATDTYTGLKLLQQPDFGVKDIEKVKISQQPYDGDLVVASRRPNRVIKLPLLIEKQANWTALMTIRTQLHAELDRDDNILEYRFPHYSDGIIPEPFFCYTTRAAIPTLLRGIDAPNPALWNRDVATIIELEADPIFVWTDGSEAPF